MKNEQIKEAVEFHKNRHCNLCPFGGMNKGEQLCTDDLLEKIYSYVCSLEAENYALTVKNEVLQRDVENLTRTLEEGGEEYRALQSENAELCARLKNSVEFPIKPDGLCFSPSVKIVPRVDKEGFVVQPVLYLSFKCDNQKQVDEIMDILEGEKNNDD